MSVEVREAALDDVAAIVAMLADDELGAARESPGDGTVVGTLQLTVIPGLARTAATRGQIEACGWPRQGGRPAWAVR